MDDKPATARHAFDPAASAAVVTTREKRLRELARLTKAQLIRLYRPHCLWSAHPLESWTKDELISSLLSVQLPAADHAPRGEL